MPYAIHTFTEVGDGAIVGLDPADANPKDSDFTVGDRSENLVRVSGDCALEWVADAADFPVDDAVHEEISVHDGRLVTETDVERYAEFDLDSGAFRDSWPLDEFVIGDRRHEFERPVESVESLDGAWLLQTARRLHWFDRTGNRLAEWSMEDLRKQDQYGDLTPKSYRVEDGKVLLVVQGDARFRRKTILFGFDETGTQLWSRQRNRDWGFHPGEDGLVVSTFLRRNTYGTVAVDVDTGAFVRVVDGPESEVERFLDT